MKLYAVINGDIIDSTKLSEDNRASYFAELKAFFVELKSKKLKLGVIRPFEIYRGDSFQGALENPEMALRLILFLRSYTRMITARKPENKENSINKTTFNSVTDIRIAIGIGTISRLTTKLSESDGEAFHRSGRLIDSMKKSGQNIAIETPWMHKNEEWEVLFSLLDAIIIRWSAPQAEVVYLSLKGMNQSQIAELLKTSTSAVNQRLKTANWNSVNKCLSYFENTIMREANE